MPSKKRAAVHDPAAGEVQEDRAIFHQRQPVGVDEVARGVQQGHVHGDEIRLGEEVVEARGLLDPRGHLPRSLDRHRRIEADHAHTEREGRVGHLDADRSQPDEADGPVLGREQLLLGLETDHRADLAAAQHLAAGVLARFVRVEADEVMCHSQVGGLSLPLSREFVRGAEAIWVWQIVGTVWIAARSE